MSNFQLKIDLLKYCSNFSLVTKPWILVVIVRNNSPGREVCHCPGHAMVSPLLHSPMFPVVIPLSTVMHQFSIHKRSFYARTRVSSAWLLHLVWGPEYLSAEETEEKVNHVLTEDDLVGPQRGSTTSVIQRILLGMQNGREITFHLYCEDNQNMRKKNNKCSAMYIVWDSRKKKSK